MAHTELDELVAASEKFEATDLRTVDDQTLDQLIRAVLRAGTSERQVIYLGPNQVWHRGHLVENTDGYSNLSRLIYPPKPKDFTRAGAPGHAMLYASRNAATVFAELGAKTGDLLQLIACRPRAHVIIRSEIIGEFEHVLNAGLSLLGYEKSVELIERLIAEDPDKFARIAFMDAFFAELFARRIPRDSSILYRPTAMIAFYLMGGRAEALMFPSVQRRGGLNVAVPGPIFDAKFEVVRSEIVRVRHLGYCQYTGEVLRVSERFEPDGTVVWEPAVGSAAGHSWSLRGGHRFADEAVPASPP